MVVIPVFIVLVTRRSFKAYGLTGTKWRENLDTGMTFALVSGVIINGCGYMVLWVRGIAVTGAPGAVVLAGCNIVVLFLILFLFKRRDRVYSGDQPNYIPNVLILLGLLMLPIVVGGYTGRLSRIVVSTVVWQFLFSGFGEEIKFRGYYQSRINQEFGRPFSFFGVDFGYGLIVSSLLFALAHVLNPFSPFAGSYELAWWWGLFTFFGGLTLGFIREKTGSIIACGIVHGLPDAVGEAFAVMFSFS